MNTARALLAQPEAQEEPDYECPECHRLNTAQLKCFECGCEWAIPVDQHPPAQMLTEFERMQLIGDEFPLALVEPIVIRKIDTVVENVERAVLRKNGLEAPRD